MAYNFTGKLRPYQVTAVERYFRSLYSQIDGVCFTIVGYNRLTRYQGVRLPTGFDVKAVMLDGMPILGYAFSSKPETDMIGYEWPLSNNPAYYRHDNPIWGASCKALGLLP